MEAEARIVNHPSRSGRFVGVGVVATVALCALTAADAQQSKPAGKSAAASTVSPADNYTRMKECAAQVDKVAKRTKLDDDPLLIGRQSHYSPTFQRCYAQVSYRNPAGNANPGTVPTT